MDVLSEVLEVVMLDGAVFYNAEYSSPWSFRSPPSRALARFVAPSAGHVIIYHLLIEGRGFARLEDGEPIPRFRHYLGEPPMSYLIRWRLQFGAHLLKSSSSSVLEIAAEVGYESEPAFNRAFKREFGLPPARFRNQSRSARAAAAHHISANPPPPVSR